MGARDATAHHPARRPFEHVAIRPNPHAERSKDHAADAASPGGASWLTANTGVWRTSPRMGAEQASCPPQMGATRRGAVKRGLVRAVARTALLGVVVLTGLLAPFAQAGIGAVDAAPFGVAAGSGGAPGTTYGANTLARFRASGNAWGQTPPSHTSAYNPPLPPPAHASGKSAAAVGASATSTALAQPISTALDPILLAAGSTPVGPALSYTSGDGLLGLDVSEHSLDLSQAVVAGTGAAPVGPYTVALTQTQGGLRAQEQQIGQFALSVRDSQGHTLAGVRLAAPLSLRFHVLPTELAGVNPNGLTLAWVGTGNVAANTPAAAAQVRYDAATGWITASSPVTVGPLPPAPSPAWGGGGPVARRGRALLPEVAPASGSPTDPGAGPLVLDGALSDANAASSEHLSMDGNQGDLGFGVPLDLPPAAGGLVPPLQLGYSSADPNGRHERQAPAGEVGDGWNLTLGSITYDSATGLFYLNGGAGDSEPLLCCMTDGNGYHWYAAHHHPELEIITADNDTNPQTSGMWFKVRTPDGLEYDLGRSGGSLRATVDSSGHLLYYEWDVSELLRNVPVTTQTPAGYLQAYSAQYWQDTATSSGLTYTRDAALKEIDYNYGPLGSGASTVRLLFNVHWPQATQSAYGGLLAATQYPTNYNCGSAPPGNTTLRCDDPVAQSGWDPAPLTMSTFTLDSMTEQVETASSVWQTVRKYQFSYAPDSPFYTCWDGQGLNYACSGEHLLSSVQEIPYQNGTAEPSVQPVTFGYTGTRKNEYHDATEYVGGNPEDAQTWWQYLNAVNDEQTGRHFTATYETGWGNTHAVPSGSQTDPTTCNFVSNCFPAGQPNSWPDDRQWPHQLVTSITDVGTGLITNYAYQLAQTCGSNCTQDAWIPPNAWSACGPGGVPPTDPPNPCLETSWQNFYNEDFMGFAQVTVTHADGSTAVTLYQAGGGWGSADWVEANAYDGQPIMEDIYQGAPTGTPLEEVRNSYLVDGNSIAICPVTSGTNQLYNNPYELCFQESASQTTYVGGGQHTSPAVPSATETWHYNTNSQTSANHYYVSLTSTAVTGNDLLADSFTNYGSTQPTFTTNYSYTYYDGGSAPFYLVNLPAQVTLSDQQSIVWACSQARYDSLGYATGLNTNLKDGLLTQSDTFSDATCGNASSRIATGIGYDGYGQPIVSTDADAMAGVSGHTGCTVPAGALLQVAPVGATSFTGCSAMDATTQAYAASQANALSQTGSTAWDVVQGVPTSSTDANHVSTTYNGPVYEYSGTPSLANFEDVYASVSEPQAANGWNTREYSYSFCAIATTSTAPCMETDRVTNLDGTDMAVSRSFSDRDGRWVETRTTGPTPGTDTVTFATYDGVNDKAFASLPCQVSAFVGGRVVVGSYTAPSGVTSGADQGSSTAYVDPATQGSSCSVNTVLASTTYYDALGRPMAADDPIQTGAGTTGSGCLLSGGTYHHTNCVQYAVVEANNVSGLPSTDSEPYFQTISVDANLHQSASYTDALGREAYAQTFTGAGQTPGNGITNYAVTSSSYDPLGRLRQATDAGGNKTSYVYNAAGRLTSVSDPDLGVWTYSYDPDGNVTESVDARGSAGTVYAGYDALDRQVWRNTTNSPTGAYVTYTYDGTTSPPGTSTPNDGIGMLTNETFAGGPNNRLTGAYALYYDARGRTYEDDLTAAGNSYSTQQSYDDADQPLTSTYPDGSTATVDYNSAGAPVDLQSKLHGSGTATYVISSTAYNSAGQIAALGYGGTPGAPVFSESFSYDGTLRPSEEKATLTGSGTPFYDLVLGYDAGSNVTSITTTLPAAGSYGGGTDHQSFCYDEFNRLVWAGTSGTPTGPAAGTCGPTPAGTTLSGADYTASYAYDTLGRMTSGPAGTYTYGDSAHPHAVTSTSNNHSYAYDTAGNATCRAPSSGTTCSGTPTGAQMTYDAEERLAAWQNTPSNPTSTDSFLYDGSGQRVEQQTTVNGTTTSSIYVGGLAEYTIKGSTSWRKYYTFAGRMVGDYDGSWHYLLSDALGSAEVQVNASGVAEESSLRNPYGATRFGTSVFMGDLGFTGQRKDSTPNLTYFNARYYDQDVGVFLSADTVRDGPNPYAYVGGMVESATDPSGHKTCLGDPCVQGDPPSTESSRSSDGGGGMGGVIGLGIAIGMGLGAAAAAVDSMFGPLWRLPQQVPGPSVSPNLPEGNDAGLGPDGAFNQRTYASAVDGATDVPFNRASDPLWKPQPTTTSTGGGGGTGPGTPTPVTESVTESAPPEAEPQPSTGGAMRRGGQCNDPDVRLAALCVFYAQRAGSYGCAGRCLVRGSINQAENVLGYGKETNNNHSEVKQYGIGLGILDQAIAGDTIRLDFISALYPCTYDCRRDIPMMTSELMAVADAKGVNLEVHWWYLNQYRGGEPYEFP